MTNGLKQMIKAHIIDSRGVYVGTEEADPMGPQPVGAIYDELPEAKNGYTRIHSGGAWAQVLDADVPRMPEPAKTYRQFTSLDYLEMFTETEQRAVKAASMSNVDVGLWYDKMLAAGFITYADPRTEAGLQALVTAGLITEARKAAIVSELTIT